MGRPFPFFSHFVTHTSYTHVHSLTLTSHIHPDTIYATFLLLCFLFRFPSRMYNVIYLGLPVPLCIFCGPPCVYIVSPIPLLILSSCASLQVGRLDNFTFTDPYIPIPIVTFSMIPHHRHVLYELVSLEINSSPTVSRRDISEIERIMADEIAWLPP